MKELLALLASLTSQMDTAEGLLGTGKDIKENKKFTAELNEKVKEIKVVQAQIKDFEDDEKAEAEARASVAALKSVPRAKTTQAGTVKTEGVDVGRDKVYDDPNLGFKNYGDVAMAVYNAAVNPSNRDPRLRVIASGNPELEAAGLRQGNGPDGGFLVPAGVRNAELQTESGLSLDLYSRTRNFTLGQEISVEIPAINETSRKDGSMYGGVTAQWLEEEKTADESEPQFRQIFLKPKQIGVFIKVSNTLLTNSPIALGQFLDMASRDVMTFKLSDAVINGDGNGKPTGILNSDALITVAKEGGQSNLTVVVENTLKMLENMTERWLSGSAWYINKRLQSQLSLFTIGGNPIFIPAGMVAGQPLATLHGLPIIKTEYNQILGDKGDIVLANLNAYITAQHGSGILSETSTHFLFDTNRTAFRFMSDADGQTWMKESVEDFIGTDKSSAFVTLAERK